jgi:hypothetical protein
MKYDRPIVHEAGSRFIIARNVSGYWQFWSKKRNKWLACGVDGMDLRNASKFILKRDARRAIKRIGDP